MDLTNAYPNKTTAAELMTWTDTRLQEIIAVINDDTTLVASSPYTALTTQFFDVTLNHSDNTTGLVYYGLPYLLGYQVVSPAPASSRDNSSYKTYSTCQL